VHFVGLFLFLLCLTLRAIFSQVSAHCSRKGPISSQNVYTGVRHITMFQSTDRIYDGGSIRL